MLRISLILNWMLDADSNTDLDGIVMVEKVSTAAVIAKKISNRQIYFMFSKSYMYII
jgi:hypothetical protein